MKRIIFRNPFITKKAREKALNYICLSDKAIKLSELAIAENNLYTARILMVSAFRYSNMAARKLGFRNITDMHTYAERYGKI